MYIIYIMKFINFLILIFYVASIRSMAFSVDSNYLATGSGDHTVKLIDLQSKTICHHFKNIHRGT